MFSKQEVKRLSFPHDAHGRAGSVLTVDPGNDQHWEELQELLVDDAHEKALGPLRRVFDVVRARGCRAVVVEHRYVDLDYRSEYAVFWAERFEDRRPLTRRVHFFA